VNSSHLSRTGDLLAAYAYPDPVPDSGWVRASMVASVDGAAAGADGRSGSLGTDADRQVFGVMRGVADAILVGRGTAEAEKYELPERRPDTDAMRARCGQATVPMLAVVSGSGAVPARLLHAQPVLPRDSAGAPRLMVFTTPRGEARHGKEIRARWGRAAVQACPGDTVDPAWAVSVLAAAGQRRILCEGGPSLLAEVIRARRVDEVCVNITPHLVGGGASRIVAAQPALESASLRLAHAFATHDTVLTRWTVQHSTDQSSR
jgi:riboflavin biosynthesis pyrimidine reductase